jgi:hypothetical protein
MAPSSHGDRAVALEEGDGDEAIALVFRSGVRKPLAGVRVRKWRPEAGEYVGCYASWGSASLHSSAEGLHLVVSIVYDTDGGLRDEQHVGHVSHDEGNTWLPREGLAPAGATEIATYAAKKPKPGSVAGARC